MNYNNHDYDDDDKPDPLLSVAIIIIGFLAMFVLAGMIMEGYNFLASETTTMYIYDKEYADHSYDSCSGGECTRVTQEAYLIKIDSGWVSTSPEIYNSIVVGSTITVRIKGIGSDQKIVSIGETNE